MLSFFNSGIIIAILSESGMLPSFRDRFTIRVISGRVSSICSRNKNVGIGSSVQCLLAVSITLISLLLAGTII